MPHLVPLIFSRHNSWSNARISLYFWDRNRFPLQDWVWEEQTPWFKGWPCTRVWFTQQVGMALRNCL